MAGFDYRLVARWFHDLFLLRRDPRYHIKKTPLGVWIQHKKQIGNSAKCKSRPQLASQGCSGVS